MTNPVLNHRRTKTDRRTHYFFRSHIRTDMDTPRTFAVNSSHSISGRVTRCLVILYPVGKNRLPAIALVAKSPDACKAITITEILKRRIGQQGERWFQYTKLEGVMVNAKSPQKPNKKGGKPKNKNQGSDGEGDDDEGEGGEDSRGGSGGGGDEEDPFQVLEEKVPVKKEGYQF